jgi:hypothetical protein
MKKTVFIIFFVFLIIAAGCSQGQNENQSITVSEEDSERNDTAASSEYETSGDFSRAEKEGIVFEWRLSGERLEVKVSAPTTGWVAAGFNPSRYMKDANILIGYVDEDGVHLSDQFGNANYSHVPDSARQGGSDFTLIGGGENGGRTELHFTIPLDSGDSSDRAMERGGTYTVLLAYGKSDDIKSIHAKRTSISIQL